MCSMCFKIYEQIDPDVHEGISGYSFSLIFVVQSDIFPHLWSGVFSNCSSMVCPQIKHLFIKSKIYTLRVLLLQIDFPGKRTRLIFYYRIVSCSTLCAHFHYSRFPAYTGVLYSLSSSSPLKGYSCSRFGHTTSKMFYKWNNHPYSLHEIPNS